jgi:hypothetical protein
MSNLETFGITPNIIRRFMNPSFDINGVQIGNLFSLTGVGSVSARVNARVLRVDLSSLGSFGVEQLAGYRVYLNTNIVTHYDIYTNTASDANGLVDLYLTVDLPPSVEAENWNIYCRTTRVDFQEDDVIEDIKLMVADVRCRLRNDYTRMLSYIAGQLLWPHDLYYDADAPFAGPYKLAFYKARNVQVWRGPFYEYAHRADDATLLKAGTHYTVTHDDEKKESYINLSYVPESGEEITVDYAHDLTPIPPSLVHMGCQNTVQHLLKRSANIRANMTYDMIKDLLADIEQHIERGVPEIDAIPLFTATKMRPRMGVGNIRALRG